MKYYLNVGSNIGNRRDHLYRAVVALVAGSSGAAVSRIVESEPWGYESDNRFLNVGLVIDSGDAPFAMLDRLHDIERQLGSAAHRDAHGNYVDRLVDIDIVAIDGQIIDLPVLQVPHPRMSQREFFLVPMMELAPCWRHPVTGLTAAQMLQELKLRQGG